MLDSPAVRLERARTSLEGLSVGDAFGDRWFFTQSTDPFVLIANRTLPTAVWEFTDDTQMALSIVSILRQYGQIDQDKLALSFGQHFERNRGYGPAMYSLLPILKAGKPWRQAAQNLFEGMGSFGNGAAMRVAPLGAYFSDDPQMASQQAQLSAELTHAHPEGVAGAIAVAVAAAWAHRLHGSVTTPTRQEFLDRILPLIPFSEVSSKAARARAMESARATLVSVTSQLGNGSGISAQDTVPYCLFCAGEYLDNYEEALWFTASGGGDIDTNCAIVGGIVALYTGIEGIPAEWRSRREPLPEWPFTESA